MFPVRRENEGQEPGSRVESWKIGDTRDIHLLIEFSTCDTQSNQFWYDKPGTVPWVEEHEPNNSEFSASYTKERREIYKD
jgi:hypothetical protein